MTSEHNEAPISSIRQKHIAENKSSRTFILKIVGGVFLAIIILYFLYYFLVLQFYVSTDDAYVNGNPVALTPQVNGVVKQILADDTQLVQAGQAVIILDPTDTLVALKQSEAVLAQTVRQVRQSFLQVDSLAAIIDEREAELKKAQADFGRREKLQLNLAVSKEDLDHAKQTYVAAQAALVSAQKQYQMASSLVQNTTIETHPSVAKARADVEQAYLAWRRTQIIAPVTGYIAKRSVQVGQQVAVGQNLLIIVPLNQLWVDANFRESQLSDIRINQPATVTADIYGNNIVFHGHVVGITAGSGSTFSLLPPQNASGNWIKVVQRVPVRIYIDAKDLKKHPLLLGLSTVVEIDTHNRDGKVLANVPVEKPAFETLIYDEQLQEAHNAAKAIIDAQTKASVPAKLPDENAGT